MKIRLALGALGLAVLAACGGGDSAPPAPSSNETTRIVAFQDVDFGLRNPAAFVFGSGNA